MPPPNQPPHVLVGLLGMMKKLTWHSGFALRRQLLPLGMTRMCELCMQAAGVPCNFVQDVGGEVCRLSQAY